MRDDQRQLKIGLLSQWKLEAEFRNLSIRIVLPIYEEMLNFEIDPAQVADLTGANIDKLKAIVAEHK